MLVYLFESSVGISIDTECEKAILHHFLTSRSQYKEIIINNTHLRRVEESPDNTYELVFIEDDSEVYRYYSPQAADELQKQLRDADDLDYINAGNFAALDFKGNIITTVEVDGITEPCKFPVKMFTQEDVMDPEKLDIGLNCCPTIINSGFDETCNNVYNYHLRFENLERDIMYKLDIDNPINSCVYEI